jgi:hypothetical protein
MVGKIAIFPKRRNEGLRHDVTIAERDADGYRVEAYCSRKG